MDSPHTPSPDPTPDPTQGESDTKPCPYCGETLKAAAFVCRFCRRDLFAPNAPPLILSATDWEIARPPSMVSEFVRMESAKLPVSPTVWTAMCLGLTSLIGVLCVNLARLPDPAKRPRQAQQAVVPLNEWQSLSTPAPTAPPEGTVPSPALQAATPELPLLTNPTPSVPFLPPQQAALPEPEPSPTPRAADTMQENARANSIGVTSPTLVATYLVTPAAAEDKYTGQYVHISGPVVSTGKNENNVPFVVLRGADNVSVRCLFAKSVKDVPQVEAGGIMRLYGTCDGKFIDVRVSDCTPG